MCYAGGLVKIEGSKDRLPAQKTRMNRGMRITNEDIRNRMSCLGNNTRLSGTARIKMIWSPLENIWHSLGTRKRGTQRRSCNKEARIVMRNLDMNENIAINRKVWRLGVERQQLVSIWCNRI